MTEIPKETIENGIHYTRHGNYYLPDFKLPKDNQPLGKYGRMRKEYLEKYRPGLYTRLILLGILYNHLKEVDDTCTRIKQKIIQDTAAQEGVNEALKADNQIQWVQMMNGIDHSAEEFVLIAYVYA